MSPWGALAIGLPIAAILGWTLALVTMSVGGMLLGLVL